ncbi:integral membrane protein Pth11-like [Fusarium beomiforme]|uniref:Integral membrane protein Pth11-like n=1 Tax=Fusarium beomiforme TaxID=44412 RepID=A0A9P5AEY3_9HYPO|nr:integral membrane protein Pth11-like [Fusarium beomiforme]
MPLYSDAPDARQFFQDKPTLLVSWWITVFCVAIILTRMAGRYVRVEKLLKEDKIVAAALVPLVLRAICVHFVLKNGTNNVNLDGLKVSSEDIDKRIVGSKMVLASRVFYACILWILKLTTLEFFERLAGATRRRSHRIMIHAMRITLGVTFLAVLISDLAECQPFPHYWQVTPDPGPQCRQGFVQLLTMGACNAFTDLVLIAFPIPIILSTQIATKRKVLLIMLFSFGLLTVGITLYRIPKIIESHGSQVVRTMWASIEILAATAVGNIVALGSFLRDSGVKRKKFKESNSYSGYSNSRSQSQPTKLTRTAGHSQWEDEMEGHAVRTTEGIWAKSHETSDSISKDEDLRKSGERPVSPTQSHDSLITRDQLQGSMDIRDEFAYQQPPTAVIAGGSREVQRAQPARNN